MRTFQTVLNRIAPVAVWALLGAGCADDGAAGGASPGAGAPVTGRGAAAADAAENPATGGVADSAALDAEIEALEQRVAALRDIAAIEKLQRTYGYYLDEADWDNLIDLFADGAIAEYGASGVYVGKDSIREFLYALGGGRSGLEPGVLNEHVQLQPVIDVAPDGLTAKARWRALGLLGRYESYATWQDGPYENEYRKEDGRWKISRIRWIERFTVPFDGGLAASEAASQEPAELPPPDRPSTIEDEPWPAVSTLPYHFPNPVTGAVTSPGDAGTASAANADAANADPANADAASTDADGTNADGTNADGANPGSTNADTAEAAPAGLAQGAPQPDTLDARAAALARDVERLEDEREIEILQRTYGYFVDKNLWREIADLFTEDGTLEIGGRGVFAGRERVLEYLEWLGDPEHGRLYDHTQMQGVVTVAPDGRTAKGRWRALVFGGNEGGISVFGDCIYENEYRKVDGVWKISKLHSYFIMYTNWDPGWAEMGWPNTRPEEELPPDRPPTVVYDMYPGELTAP
ncbi:MAG: nuclear transport factor 2 family protein, partial [Gammaproteobacteria bacterium]|nr:nuclear transport factor 2 family protein [Gammaproteobacteria bacterium]